MAGGTAVALYDQRPIVLSLEVETAPILILSDEGGSHRHSRLHSRLRRRLSPYHSLTRRRPLAQLLIIHLVIHLLIHGPPPVRRGQRGTGCQYQVQRDCKTLTRNLLRRPGVAAVV